MAVKRRQKDDNHGTLEDKSQGPLVSDKGRERDGSQGRSGNKTQTLSLLPSLICTRGRILCCNKSGTPADIQSRAVFHDIGAAMTN